MIKRISNITTLINSYRSIFRETNQNIDGYERFQEIFAILTIQYQLLFLTFYRIVMSGLLQMISNTMRK